MSSCSSVKMIESSLETPLKYKSLKYGMIKEDISVMEKFELIKELGFHGVELDWPNQLNEQEILKARDATGIHIPGTVNSVHWKKQLSNPDPAIRQECVDATIEALHKTNLYGGTTVLLVPGVVNEDIRYDEAWDRSTAEILSLIHI